MDSSLYQMLAMRTNDGLSTDRLENFVAKNSIPFTVTDTNDPGGLIMACLGIAGEGGEICDLVKKWIFHEKEVDTTHLKKELSDVLWYCAMLAQSMGWDISEVMQVNIDKLKARYPEGFSAERANNRKKGDI